MNKRLVPKLRFPEFDGEWRSCKFGDVGKFIGGGTPSTKNDSYWIGDIPWISSSDLVEGDIHSINAKRFITREAVDNSATKLIPQGSVLIVSRVGVGKVAINKFPLCTSQDFQNVILDLSNEVFIAYLVQLKASKLIEFNQGTSIKGFVKEDLINLVLALPILPEQTKITDFLTAVDDKIQQLTRKKELLEQYKKGVMQQIFSQKIRFKDDSGNDYSDWKIKQLEEIANYRRGSFPQPYGLDMWYDEINGFPFVQVFDVADNMQLKPKTKNKISSLAAQQSVFVREGNLVITIQGSIGRVAKLQYDAYIDRTLLIFQSYKALINVDYFKYVLFLLFETEKLKAPGGTIKTITKEVLSEFVVDIPSIMEQNKIANFLTSVDDKITQILNQIAQINLFKTTLLQKMFV